uniref:Uncharacterized protein n=1 Tax=Branchiostoma floridae TaxID=7739 RepID=C3ZL27_BRAFL|eukprot:XP_002590698.1 hypothetical protein BRAFLDRAFT_89502 [Branchiostoma floridae]
MCELRHLDLNRNYIVSLRDFIFSDLTALWNLLLSNNLISAISERAFHGLASLQFLGLAGNRLSVFPAQAIGLIPSKQLLLVSLMVNSISQIPGDIKFAHPSASYQLEGNPLRCPEKQVAREDMINVADMDSWPVRRFYVIDTTPELNRSIVKNVFFIKSRHKYFGVLPNTYYLTEHHSVALPLVQLARPGPEFEHYTWYTPTGRYVVRPLTKVLEIQNFTAKNSGRYTSEMVSGTKSHHMDLLLCLDWRRKEDQKESTTIPPSKKFSPRGIENETDICEGSTDKFCCSYWLAFKPSFHQKFCVVTNSHEKPSVSFIIPIITVVAILMILFPIALVCWRKRGTSREDNRPDAGATLNMDAQAKGVCGHRYTLPEVTEGSTEGESDPNAFPLRRLRSRESHWFAMEMGNTTVYTVGTTEAQVHHYDNASDADDEEGQHHSPSAPPPPLPVREENTAHTVTANVLEGASDQPAFQIGKTETGAEIMPYGVAAGNSLYQRDSDFTLGSLFSEQASNAADYCATGASKMAERLHTSAEANVLYQRDSAPNRRAITDEHTSSVAADCSAAIDANQTEETLHTITTAEENILYERQRAMPLNRRALAGEPDAGSAAHFETGAHQTETVTPELCGRQTDHANMARGISAISHDSEEDFGILYGTGPATAE